MRHIVFLLILLSSLQSHGENFYLTPNESSIINIPVGQTVRVKGKKIILIEDLGKKIKVIGLQQGVATINIGASIYQIYVVQKNKLDFLKAVKEKLRGFLGLNVELREGDIALTGHLYRLSDWQEISELAEIHATSYVINAQIDSDVKEAAKNWIAERLAEAGLAQPLLVFTPKVQAVISDEQKNLATLWDQALSPLGVAQLYEKSQLAIEPLVRVNIVVAEINKNLQSKLGIEWPKVLSANLAPSFSGPTKLEVFLKALEEKGLGQVLASPNLLARSGGEAEFLAGGEIPIKIITPRVKEVQWKRHGIYLKIKPKADRSGRLSIELSTEVSLLDAASVGNDIPSLKTSRMTTHFDLSQAKTIILSGLIRSDWGKNYEGLPQLARLPLLGALFRSENFYNRRTELVIFVTPEIVNDQEPSPKNILPKNWRPSDDSSFDSY
ncbi:MAG: hypothetical protein A2Z20_10205 [Bdellovibrionales bacterium RBG_16_40_8]|nr:MAG: hypothetical protein A2Z20_10205 [Bdellovibrionales bacterium RBG_16_40_8]